MKKRAPPVTAKRAALDQAGRYGSLSLVTGLILKVFTDVSNSINR